MPAVISDIPAMRGISACHFTVVMHLKNVALACMIPLLMKISTRVVNWYNNILGYRKFSHKLYYNGSSWNVLKEFCNWKEFEIVYNFAVQILLQPIENMKFNGYFMVNFYEVACHVKSPRVPLQACVP